MKSLKKEQNLESVNTQLIQQLQPTAVSIVKCIEEVELDEMWSFVGSKQQQRWLWHAIDHQTGFVLAYVLADHKNAAFIQLQAMLKPFSIQQFYTDNWGAYERYLGKDSGI